MIDIPGYERYQVTKEGKVYTKKYKRFLNGYKGSTGYYMVELYANGKGKRFLVHRLVAKAYVPNPYNYPHVNHKDSDRMNPRWDNLEWCTQTINAQHAMRQGTHQALKYRKLTPEIRQDIIKMRRSGMTGVEIAKKLDVSFHCIYQYLAGKSYVAHRNEVLRIR